MSINFLTQIVRILHVGIYDETELRMIYDYLRKLDESELNLFFNSYTVILYNNDLEICIEVLDKMLYILEDREEYEKCQILKDKKDEAINVMKLIPNKNECA